MTIKISESSSLLLANKFEISIVVFIGIVDSIITKDTEIDRAAFNLNLPHLLHLLGGTQIRKA